MISIEEKRLARQKLLTLAQRAAVMGEPPERWLLHVERTMPRATSTLGRKELSHLAQLVWRESRRRA